MKHTLFFSILFALLPFWTLAQNAQKQKTPNVPCNGSQNTNGSDELCKNVYCYCSKATSSDSWDEIIGAVGNEAGFVVEFSYDEIIFNRTGPVTVPHPWAPANFPIVLGSGNGSISTNIKIRILWAAYDPDAISPPDLIDCQVLFPDGYIGWSFNVNACK